ncbi:MAG: FHA domain-containing protein [Sulfuricellaceae bacterium]
MFKFEFFLEKKLLREYFFDKNLAVTLGRRPSHDIHINHMGVSADHAKIHFFPDCLLEDLGSKNGTTLNEQRIDKTAKLSHGDVIGIVNYRLRFIDRKKITPPDNSWEEDEHASTWVIAFPNDKTPRTDQKKVAGILQSLKMTPREFECLFWLAHEKSIGEISQALKISESMTHSHIASLCKKLGAANRTQAIAMAISLNLIEP